MNPSPTPLPPIPLTNGHFLIDNSGLEPLNLCPRKSAYSLLYKRRPAEDKWALRFGGLIHKALELRYKQEPDMCSGTETEQQQMSILEQGFLETPCPDGQFRTLELAQGLIRGYNQKFLSEPWSTVEDQDGKPIVEVSFIQPLGTLRHPLGPTEGIPVDYIGRIDLVVAEDGGIYTLDWKTTSIMGKGFWDEMTISPQFEGYCWAWWKQSGDLPKGYIVRALRTRAPLKSERAEGEKPNMKRRKSIEDDDFQEQRTYVDEARLLEWQRNTMMMLQNWYHMVLINNLPAHKKSCVGKYGLCEFFEVCNLPENNRLTMLRSGLFTDSTWSPLDR